MLRFDEVTHSYHDEYGQLDSVSKVIGHFIPPFDPGGYILKRVATTRGVETDEVQAEWDDKRDTSIDKGNILHNDLEQFVHKYRKKKIGGETPQPAFSQ